MIQPGLLDDARFSALGEMPLLIVDTNCWQPPTMQMQSIIVGCDYDGILPEIDAGQFDLLLTSSDRAPAPWVSLPPATISRHAAQISEAVHHCPISASLGCRTLRLVEALSFAEAIEVESLAYSILLGGEEFKRWRASVPAGVAKESDQELVRYERAGNHVTLTLDQPETKNAMTAQMRDALFTALANIIEDPSLPTLAVRGAGKCFSTGGALTEFGSADDLAKAHIIRTLRSCAKMIDMLGARAAVHIHGACIGSGIEIAAAAARRTASRDAWLQLPELQIGLMPGAGGTVTLSRAIGRHRTAWMLLTGKRINAQTALDWGLVHEIVDTA